MAAFLLVSLVSLCILAALTIWRRGPRRRRTWRLQEDRKATGDRTVEGSPYEDIEPLEDFDLESTLPIQNCPFKPKYHLTMALENISISEILAMDKTYAERMTVRQNIMLENPDATVQCTTSCEPAVKELYSWMFNTFLPSRFPTIYEKQPSHLLNKIADENIPLASPSPIQALRTLGAHVDTDFLLLLPSSTGPDGLPIYHLCAFVCCFPSGFSLRRKLNMPLAEIHKPVPGYKAKLEKSMDRFFARLEVGKAVRRANWAITTDERLFSEGGFHLYEDGKEGEEEEKEKRDGATSVERKEDSEDEKLAAVSLQKQIDEQKASVAVERCRLRSERQVLFRLPESKALVFAFKTYQYRLEEVKRDGYGEALAMAIEGLTKGNVPEFHYYKRGVVWGDAILEFLRS